jgi:hypothetical protein
MLKLDFLGHYDFAEMLMLAASVVVVVSILIAIWIAKAWAIHLAAPIPRRRFVTDFRERAKLGGLGLIFLRHSPEFGSDFYARRYPWVTGAKSRNLHQLVVGHHHDRLVPLYGIGN